MINNLVQKENEVQARHNRSARADMHRTQESVRLAFSEFVLVVLHYQLRKHEEFLSGFVQLFKSVDRDMDGVVDENEFIELIEKMKIGLNES